MLVDFVYVSFQYYVLVVLSSLKVHFGNQPKKIA